MPTTYDAPGVYVEEVDTGIKTIEGVGTSIAGFVGATLSGPHKGLPQLVTSFGEFETLYGGFFPVNAGFPGHRDLPHAVHGFFLNGGKQLYIARAGDGSAAPAVADYIGNVGDPPGQRTGIKALEDIDGISIIAAPGQTDVNVQKALIDQCELLQDRFAILDPDPAANTALLIENQRNQYNTRYAAIYYPQLRVFDPVTGTEITVPPSGHMAGIYARVDTERGVHKAPANEIVRGAVNFSVVVNKETQGILNPKNINVFRDFRADGRGLRIWGARVMVDASDAAWKYINVRRLFLFIEESIDEGTQWVVFEPNDEPLWARVRQSISAFLTRVWRDGALQGATQEEAFFVKCDRSTMTQDDLENGRLICLVGVAPVKPAEFVIIRISQFTASANS